MGAVFRVPGVFTAEGHPCLSVLDGRSPLKSAELRKFLKCEICLCECFLQRVEKAYAPTVDGWGVGGGLEAVQFIFYRFE